MKRTSLNYISNMLSKKLVLMPHTTVNGEDLEHIVRGSHEEGHVVLIHRDMFTEMYGLS